jgi:hypothetical protein
MAPSIPQLVRNFSFSKKWFQSSERITDRTITHHNRFVNKGVRNRTSLTGTEKAEVLNVYQNAKTPPEVGFGCNSINSTWQGHVEYLDMTASRSGK